MWLHFAGTRLSETNLEKQAMIIPNINFKAFPEIILIAFLLGNKADCRCPMLNAINHLDHTYTPFENVSWQEQSITGILENTHTAASNNRIAFCMEQAFYTSWLHHPASGAASHQTWYLLHAMAEYNLVKSSSNDGTWLRVELSGSSLPGKKKNGIDSLDESYGLSCPTHNDIFKSGMYYLPEILISQGIMHGKGILMFGMVNQANYLDTNTYANCTFGQFTNYAFVNNQVLPLADSNFGIVLQLALAKSAYFQLAGSMIDNEPNRSPFKHTSGKNFNLIGELGIEREHGIGTGTYRLQPFIFHNSGKGIKGGAAVNCEQQLGKNSPLAIFARTGWSGTSTGNPAGASYQASSGITISKPFENIGLLKESDLNVLGFAIAVTKPDRRIIDEGRNTAWREITFECTYACYITRFWSIQPTYQFVRNPAARGDTRSASIFALQSNLHF